MTWNEQIEFKVDVGIMRQNYGGEVLERYDKLDYSRWSEEFFFWYVARDSSAPPFPLQSLPPSLRVLNMSQFQPRTLMGPRSRWKRRRRFVRVRMAT